MTAFKKNILFFGIILCGFSCGFTQAQSSRMYRIIAHSINNLSVTSASNETAIFPAMTLYIPNAFTPNGDGLNDTFGVTGEAIKNFSMVIYDRWGVKLFETIEASKHWAGNYKNHKAPSGTYVYMISAQSIRGNTEYKQGTVDLIE